MKKLALLLLCIWVGLAGAMTMDMEAQGMNQAFRITGRTANTMNISFSPGSFRIEEERVGDTVYQHIVMPGASSTIDEGMPELPLIGASVIVPAHGTVSVRSNATNPRSLGVFKPYPVQQRMDLESPKSFLYNDEFFSGNSTYPAVTTSYSEPAILRDFRFVSLQVSPFFYDAGTGELSVYDNLELELEFGNGPGLNELAEEPSYVSPY
ncbi:MAG TPA: C25 family peptidase propeptide domain-containing protein, partial [Candidatus Cloacimonadota bacterium]|nr:C25 family peptidase propeptide domain-containing protein [Candidatus Cloacimonadota bacterium]